MAEFFTLQSGAPIGDNTNSLTAGRNGPVLLQDLQLVEKLAHFDRERIPERVVHARGVGAFGEFVATADLSDLTDATIFRNGKVTPLFLRFSTVINSKGSPETVRDPRGFAIKFYTDEGNWDLVGNNLPVFFIRDSILFSELIHSLKPSPVTNLQDPNRYFDFLSFVPESTNMLTHLYSPLGIPANYRQMDGFGVHGFKFTRQDCQNNHLVKFNWRSRQGVVGLTPDQAARIQAFDFNNATRDLYDAIRRGDFPKWDLEIQVVPESQIDDYDFDLLDATKIWPEDLFPPRKVGELTLNRIPDNFYQASEQVAFCPNFINGIEASNDRMLQGRLFSYRDTQRYRLGVNNEYLPINRPAVPVNNTNIDGAGCKAPQVGQVNYQPSNYKDLIVNPRFKPCPFKVGPVTTQEPIAIEKQRNFVQAGVLYREFSQEYRDSLIEAFSADLKQVTGLDSSDTEKAYNIRVTICAFLYNADVEYGTRVAERVDVNLRDVVRKAAEYPQ